MIPVGDLHDDDLAGMRAAIDMARHALPTGDVPVGAVVLAPDGVPIAGACNRREGLADPTGHAEIVALRAAGARSPSMALIG
jgi:tRNA(adenine34) deaminase